MESTGEPLKILPLRASQLKKYRAELGAYTGLGDKELKGTAIADSIVGQLELIHKLQQERHKKAIDLDDFLDSVEPSMMQSLWSAVLGQEPKNAPSPA